MSGFFTAFHSNCNACEAEAEQCQRARLGNLGSANCDNHVVVVIVAYVTVIQADYKVIILNVEEAEVCAGIGLGNVVELPAIVRIVVDGNTATVDELEVQQGVKATVEYSTVLVIYGTIGIEYQRVTPVKLVVVRSFFTQVGKGQLERIGAG